MVVRIWIVVERALWRAFFGPSLQGGEFLERRQVVAAAGCNEFLNRSRLRQMDEQALRGFLVLGKVPCGPEEGKEWRKTALWTHGEAMSPALLRDLRRIAFGNGPCARRIHDQGALAGNQPLVVTGVVPCRCIGRQECHQFLVKLKCLADGVGLNRDVGLAIDELRAKGEEECAGRVDGITGCTESNSQPTPALVACFRRA